MLSKKKVLEWIKEFGEYLSEVEDDLYYLDGQRTVLKQLRFYIDSGEFDADREPEKTCGYTPCKDISGGVWP